MRHFPVFLELIGRVAFVLGEGEAAGLVCPRCGLSYLEFRKTGRLGCPDDYEFFRKGLLPFLEKIHLATQHVGKIPSRADVRTHQVKELITLRRQLSSLVDREAYEEAAKVRDRIKTLEETGDGV